MGKAVAAGDALEHVGSFCQVHTEVQTLFYGLFAAWVFWAEQQLPTDTAARFRWREAAWYLHIPILSKLYQDFANPQLLGTMHLEWASGRDERMQNT